MKRKMTPQFILYLVNINFQLNFKKNKISTIHLINLLN